MEREALLAAVEDSVTLKRSFFTNQAGNLLLAGRMLSEALGSGKKLLVFGNGGSAADAQHLSAELVNRFRIDRPGLAAIALTTDSSILTSVANDADYQSIFSRQVEALGTPGDIALGISTSGNSPNVVQAVERAGAMGLKTLGLAGRDGGKLSLLVDLCLTVPHDDTARIQEVHAMIVHFLCQIVEEALYPDESHAKAGASADAS